MHDVEVDIKIIKRKGEPLQSSNIRNMAKSDDKSVNVPENDDGDAGSKIDAYLGNKFDEPARTTNGVAHIKSMYEN